MEELSLHFLLQLSLAQGWVSASVVERHMPHSSKPMEDLSVHVLNASACSFLVPCSSNRQLQHVSASLLLNAAHSVPATQCSLLAVIICLPSAG